MSAPALAVTERDRSAGAGSGSAIDRMIGGAIDRLDERQRAILLPTLLRPTADPADPIGTLRARSLLDANPTLPPAGLEPFAIVDEASFACVVTEPSNALPPVGSVARVFVRPVKPEHQVTIADVDLESYLESVAAERHSRTASFERVMELGERYAQDYVATSRHPRSFVARPGRIACQNVVVAVFAVAYDARFDGIQVTAAAAADVGHVVTFEPMRALLASLLCDAYQHSTTLEVRFDRHPERSVPSELRRWARAHGCAIGEEDPRAITPREVRAVFPVVAQAPPALAHAIAGEARRGHLAPERASYLLMTDTWSNASMEYLLRSSPLGLDLLHGGSPAEFRAARQPELALGQAALLLERFVSAASAVDKATARTPGGWVEDSRRTVSIEVDEQLAAVRVDGAPLQALRWESAGVDPTAPALWVVPRPWCDSEAIDVALECSRRGTTVMLLPGGESAVAALNLGLGAVWCPQRIEVLSSELRERLTTAKGVG